MPLSYESIYLAQLHDAHDMMLNGDCYHEVADLCDEWGRSIIHLNYVGCT